MDVFPAQFAGEEQLCSHWQAMPRKDVLLGDPDFNPWPGNGVAGLLAPGPEEGFPSAQGYQGWWGWEGQEGSMFQGERLNIQQKVHQKGIKEGWN